MSLGLSRMSVCLQLCVMSVILPAGEQGDDVSRRHAIDLAMGNKRGPKVGTQRGNRQRFPYEPRVARGKLLMPAELLAIHSYMVETPVREVVTEEIRAVVETVWPELKSMLPPTP